MTADAPQRRSALLPGLDRSRAVLVACDVDAIRVPDSQPSACAAKLAEALTSADIGMAFRPGNVTVVASWQHPAEVFDAVRRAAEEASDVLLFHYVGFRARHQEFVLPGSESLAPALIADAEQRIFTPPHPRAGGAFAMAPLEAGRRHLRHPRKPQARRRHRRVDHPSRTDHPPPRLATAGL